MIFHTVTLGGTAVAGFFLLSGYLISQSMTRSTAMKDYLHRRVLRIVPGYIVAYILSFFVLGAILDLNIMNYLKQAIVYMAFLHEPPVFGAQEFSINYHTLNGALWTIGYEFRCYIIVAVLSLSGILKKGWKIVALTIMMVTMATVVSFPSIGSTLDEVVKIPGSALILGIPSRTVFFTAIFLVGSVIFLYRDEILPRLTGWVAAGVTGALVLVLFVPYIASVALPVLGAVPLFWLAMRCDFGRFQSINDRWDISYGTYLYGWPAAMILLLIFPQIAPWQLAGGALILAMLAGAASWWGIEKPFKDWGRPRRQAATA